MNPYLSYREVFSLLSFLIKNKDLKNIIKFQDEFKEKLLKKPGMIVKGYRNFSLEEIENCSSFIIDKTYVFSLIRSPIASGDLSLKELSNEYVFLLIAIYIQGGMGKNEVGEISLIRVYDKLIRVYHKKSLDQLVDGSGDIIPIEALKYVSSSCIHLIHDKGISELFKLLLKNIENLKDNFNHNPYFLVSVEYIRSILNIRSILTSQGNVLDKFNTSFIIAMFMYETQRSYKEISGIIYDSSGLTVHYENGEEKTNLGIKFPKIRTKEERREYYKNRNMKK